MKFSLSILFVFVITFAAFGQKSVKELQPSHAVALRDFLDRNSSYYFLSEELYDSEYLKELRTNKGKSYKPYYKIGDFNGDKFLDFALMLKRDGKPISEGQDEPYAYSYPLAVIVFTGSKEGKFRKAFIKDEMLPYVMFFEWTNEKRKRLFYGMDGGLGGTALTPVGKGFIAETIYEN